MEHRTIQPIWIDEKGTIWEYDAAHEQCEFNFRSDEGNLNDECLNPREYIGRCRNGELKYLCRDHFEEIKKSCKEIKVSVS